MGRPSIYSDKIANDIADRLASGESLASICADEKMPGLRTVVRWSKENPDFGTIYAHAREAQAEEMDRKVLQAADDADEDNAAAMRVKIDAYKWRAARLNPHRYGDKVDVTSGGEKIKPPTSTLAIQVAALLNGVVARLKQENGDGGD